MPPIFKQALSYLAPVILGTSTLVAILYFLSGSAPDSFELFGVMFNIWSITLIRKKNIIGWFAAIISASLIGIFSMLNLIYGQAILQLCFFLPTNTYAFFTWLKSIKDETTSWLSPKERILAVILFVLGMILAFATIKTPDPTIRTFDILALSFILTGHLLMVLKKRESWLIFIPGNIIASIVFFLIGSYLLSLLNIFFFINSCIAFAQWKKPSVSEKNLKEPI